MAQPQHYRNSSTIEKMVLNKWFWVLAVGFFFAYPLLKSMTRALPDSLPVYQSMPEFSFTDETGQTFGSQELRGRVYLVHLMNTRCAGECSLSFREMQEVQHRIRGVKDRTTIISLTTDPEFDTTEVLYSKARELKADPPVWRFLRAAPEATKAFVMEGLQMKRTDGKTVASVDEALRADRLVLVDQDGNVRGQYTIEKTDINKLMIDLGLLINRKKNT